MGFIAQRIIDEERKHRKNIPEEWALICEKKIIAELKERGIIKNKKGIKMNLRDKFENLWKTYQMSNKFKEKDKRAIYQVFLDGYGISLIDKGVERLKSIKKKKMKNPEEIIKDLKEKYEICLKLKEYDRAKKYLQQIKEIENE